MRSILAFKRPLWALLVAFLLFSPSLFAQYCTPAVSDNWLHFTGVDFTYDNHIVGAVNHVTSNDGYTATVNSSSGTINRYTTYLIWISVLSSAPTVPFTVKMYADVNNDGDFEDTLENVMTINQVTSNSNIGFNTAFNLPLHTLPGDIRVRFIIAMSGDVITPCGAVNGEVEDYILTVNDNTAPVLDNASEPFLDPLLQSNTNNEGFSVNQLIYSTQPAHTMIADADDMGTTFSNEVPRGIAITGVAATNGTWQYRLDNTGTWTNITAVSESNALLLLGNVDDPRYNSKNYIRFVPTGTGTSSITYRAWDGTEGLSGDFINIMSTGGITAFSTTSETATLTTASNGGSSPSALFISTNGNNIVRSIINNTNGTIYQYQNILSGSADYSSNDMEYDPIDNKLVWISGDFLHVYKSDINGSNVQTVATNPNGIIGLAVSDNIYYNSYLFSLNQISKSGTNPITLSSIISGFTALDMGDVGDMEIDNNFIYTWYYSLSGTSYRLIRFNKNGTGLSILRSTINLPGKINISNNRIYTSEFTGTGTEIYSLPITGGSIAPIATINDYVYTDLAADPANDRLYALTTTASGNAVVDLFTISTGAGTRLLTLPDGAVSMTLQASAEGPLPVQLLSFTAARSGEHAARINWQTAFEQNNSHFILEKSTDDNNYTVLTTIKGNSSTDQASSYHFEDNNALSPINYYRLWQTDVDGQKKNLGTKIVRMPTSSNTASIYPNPVTDVVTIDFPDNTAKDILISTTLGNIVFSKQHINTYRLQIEASGWAAGTYYIRVIENGKSVMLKTIIKK